MCTRPAVGAVDRVLQPLGQQGPVRCCRRVGHDVPWENAALRLMQLRLNSTFNGIELLHLLLLSWGATRHTRLGRCFQLGYVELQKRCMQGLGWGAEVCWLGKLGAAADGWPKHAVWLIHTTANASIYLQHNFKEGD